MPPTVALTQETGANPGTIGTFNGVAIDITNWGAVLFTLNVGTPGAGGKVDAKIQESDDAAFSSPSDVPGAVFAQMAAAGIAVGLVKKIGLGAVVRKQFLRAVVTTSVAAVPFSTSATRLDPVDSKQGDVLAFEV